MTAVAPEVGRRSVEVALLDPYGLEPFRLLRLADRPGKGHHGTIPLDRGLRAFRRRRTNHGTQASATTSRVTFQPVVCGRASVAALSAHDTPMSDHKESGVRGQRGTFGSS